MNIAYVEYFEGLEETLIKSFKDHKENIVVIGGKEYSLPMVFNISGMEMKNLSEVLLKSYRYFDELLTVNDPSPSAKERIEIRIKSAVTAAKMGGLDIIVVFKGEINDYVRDLLKKYVRSKNARRR